MSYSKIKESLELCPRVKEICQPLFDSVGMVFFRFVRTEKDGKRINLCTSEYWLKKYYDEKFYVEEYANFYIVPKNFKGISINVEFQDYKYKENPICTFWMDIEEKLKLSTLMTVYESFDDYIELANFGFSKSKKNTYNLFLNNQLLFEKFLLHFKSQMQEHFPKPVQLGERVNQSRDSFFLKKWIHGVDTKALNKLSSDLHVDKLYLDGEFCEQYLTHTECHCLKLVIQGQRYEQISDKLNLSKRSIENIMRNIKQKIGAQSKADLFEFALKYEIGHKLKIIIKD